MSNGNLVPSNNNNDIIQVVGVGTSIASYIISQLSKYTAEVLASGVVGIVIAIEKTQVTIRYTKRQLRKQAQATYVITVREDIALRFSRAIDRAETNPNLRPSIRDKLMKELDSDFDEIFAQIREELKKDRLEL